MLDSIISENATIEIYQFNMHLYLPVVNKLTVILPSVFLLPNQHCHTAANSNKLLDFLSIKPAGG